MRDVIKDILGLVAIIVTMFVLLLFGVGSGGYTLHAQTSDNPRVQAYEEVKATMPSREDIYNEVRKAYPDRVEMLDMLERPSQMDEDEYLEFWKARWMDLLTELAHVADRISNVELDPDATIDEMIEVRDTLAHLMTLMDRHLAQVKEMITIYNLGPNSEGHFLISDSALDHYTDMVFYINYSNTILDDMGIDAEKPR